MQGWSKARLWVDLSSCQARIEHLDDCLLRTYLGGRGLNVRLLYDLVTAATDPLGPENPLIIGTGPLTGTWVPATGRHNITAKSPATGILGDSSSGGFWAAEMRYAGYDQIVIRGASEKPVYLLISDGHTEIRDASALWGKTTWETDRLIKAELGDASVQVACIGQAGENLVKFAGVMNNLARAAGRTGMGAVMGSKRLKAIAIRGTTPVRPSNPPGLKQAICKMLDGIYGSPSYGVRSKYGTPILVETYGAAGLLSTNNCQTGVFPNAADIGGERLLSEFVTNLKSCFACPVHCSRYYRVHSGPYAGSYGEGPEFETMCSMGSRCGNANLESILHVNMLANQYGLDTISAGNMIAFAMECFEKGLLSKSDTDGAELTWGNHAAIVSLVRKIAFREGLGDLLAEGVRASSAQIPGSESFAMHVKGLEPPEQEVRGLKAWALGWAVSSRGADHLRAYPVAETTWTREQAMAFFGTDKVVDRSTHEGKPELVKWSEEICAVADCLEMCKIAQMAVGIPMDLVAEALRAVTGWDTGPEELRLIGERIINLERLFNAREGVSREDDKVPMRFAVEPLLEGPSEGQIADLGEMLDRYYKLREWDPITGLPTEGKLKDLGLL